MNNNLPDDCQGNNPRFPWNEPDEIECPECGSSMTYDNDDDLQCDECEHEIILDDADYSEDFE